MLGQRSAEYTGPNDHGALLVIRTYTDLLLQTMISIRGDIFIRFQQSTGGWSDWKKISGTNYE